MCNRIQRIRFQSFLCVLCVLCGEFFLAERGNAAQEVVLLSNEHFTAELTSIDATGRVAFQPSRSVPVAEIVRWGHPVDPRPQPYILLNDGSRIVAAAAWSGAVPLELAGDELVVRSDLLDDLHLPRTLVRGIVFAERSHPLDRRRLEDSLRAERPASRKQDELLLTNDDRLKGNVAEIAGGTLTITMESGNAKFPLSRIQCVSFGDPDDASLLPSGRMLVGLQDGSLVRASSVIADDKSVAIEVTPNGWKLTGGKVGDIVALQSLGGPRLLYLSDLEPSSYRHVPYLSIEWPYERDRNVRGGPLMANGNRYFKGLGMHSAARLTYPLAAADGWRRIEATIAIDDSAGGRGSVTFGVHVQRGGRWQAAFTSEIIRGGEKPVDFSVDVSGATGLTLTVDYAERGDELDHADWLDARLVK
jgi:hypothetical protein